MRKLILLMTILLALPALAQAQALPDPSLQAAIAAANEAVPDLGDPVRWEFEILLPTADSALGCSLVPGVQLAEQRTPYIITLYYGPEEETSYIVHASGDGSRVQRCDIGFPVMGMARVPVLPQATASDACVVTPNGPFANVRAIPEVDAPQTTEITTERQALGRNEDFTWYLVAEGWVAGTVVNTSGNCLSNDLSIRSNDIAASLAPSIDGTPGPTPFATPEQTADQFVCPEGFEGYLTPRIRTGEVTAQVEQGGIPNVIRALPTTGSAQVGTVQPGRRIDLVLAGPRCSDGFVWWEISIDGVRGWTAESSAEAEAYFLAPTPGNAVSSGDADDSATAENTGAVTAETLDPAARAIITVDAAFSLAEVGRLLPETAGLSTGLSASDRYYFTRDRNAFSTQIGDTGGELLATTDEGVVYTAVTLENPEIGDELVYLGRSDGGVAAYATLDDSIRLDVALHDSPVNVIAFDAENTVVATGSGSADTDPATWTLRLWDRDTLSTGDTAAARLRSIRFPYPVTDIAFSADGAYMAVIAQQTTPDPAVAIWIYADGGLGENVLTEALPVAGEAFVTAVPAPNNGFIFPRANDLTLINPANGDERLLVSQESMTALGDAAFNPLDPNTLAVVGGAADGGGLSLYDYAGLVANPAPDSAPLVETDPGTLHFGVNGDTLTVVLEDGGLITYALP